MKVARENRISKDIYIYVMIIWNNKPFVFVCYIFHQVVFFTNSGKEATELAMLIARLYTGCHDIISLLIITLSPFISLYKTFLFLLLPHSPFPHSLIRFGSGLCYRNLHRKILSRRSENGGIPSDEARAAAIATASLAAQLFYVGSERRKGSRGRAGASTVRLLPAAICGPHRWGDSGEAQGVS